MTFYRIFFLSHVACAFLSYAAFTIAFIAGVFYLIQDRQIKGKTLGLFYNKLAPLHVLEGLIYRAIAFGFVLLTVSLAVGFFLFPTQPRHGLDGAMAFSLLLWSFHLVVLYFRHARQWRGKKIVLFSTLAFSLVLCTFLGIHILGTPLHSFSG